MKLNADLALLIGLLIQLAGFIAVIVIFLAQNKLNKRVIKREIYQRLELASIDLFRFELENPELTWRLYDENYQLPHEIAREYWEIISPKFGQN